MRNRFHARLFRAGVCLCLLMGPLAFHPSAGHAFPYELEILDAAAIGALADDALINQYIETIIELDAVRIFYTRAGIISAREFNKLKALLRYRINLILEMQKRKLLVPALESAEQLPL